MTAGGSTVRHPRGPLGMLRGVVPGAGMARGLGPASLALLALLAGCGADAPTPPPAPTVTVVRAEQREVIEWDEYMGRLEALETVELRARVTGYLQSVHFEDGRVVESGDLLFVIDPRPYEAALLRAQAALDEVAAQAMLAETNFARAEHLHAQNVLSDQARETSENDLQRARAARAAAEAARRSAQLDLEFTQVRSPIRGRIGRTLVSVGNLISDSTPLATVVSLDPIYAYFEVDERSFLKFREIATDAEAVDGGPPQGVRTPIEMALTDEVGFPRTGELDFVDNRMDAASATVQLRGVFGNPGLELIPGLFARVRIPVSKPGPAVLIPDEAIRTDQDQEFVYVVGDDDKVVRRRVDLGPIAEGLRIVRDGLRPGDRVVVTGGQELREGTQVRSAERSIGDEPRPALASGGPGGTDRGAAAGLRTGTGLGFAAPGGR